MRARSSGRSRPRLAAVAALAAVLVLAVAFGSRGEAPPPPQIAAERAQPLQPELPVPAEPIASVPPPAAPARAAGPMSTAPMPTASEDDLMQRLRAEVDANPQAAVALADDGDRRYPETQYSDERAFLRMRGLVHLGDIGMARDAARRFYERYPDSPLGRFVFRLTGMRPLPRLGPP